MRRESREALKGDLERRENEGSNVWRLHIGSRQCSVIIEEGREDMEEREGCVAVMKEK